MRISAAACGLSAVALLANVPIGQVVNNATICDGANIPQPFVREVLRKLAAPGIVVGVRGIGDGFRQAKPAHRIPT